MNIRQLKTFIAVAEHPTFTAAGVAVALSHSAVSLQIKGMEEELGVLLVDRGRRPTQLTDYGFALLERAHRLIDLMDEIAGIGDERQLSGSLRVGVVPTALATLLPPALVALRDSQPRLQIYIASGLSGELALRVRNGDLDVAVSTAPEPVPEDLRVRTIASESLYVIAPEDAAEGTAAELLSAHPFIWFSRKTWAGQQIEAHIRTQRLRIREAMEVDSLDAIVALVAHGLGVAIVPQRVAAPPLPDRLRQLPFGDPQYCRTLALLERPHNPRQRLANVLLAELRRVAVGVQHPR